MKILILNILVLTASAVLANNDGALNNNKEKPIEGGGSSTSTSFFQQDQAQLSSSVVNINGNSISKSVRVVNGKQEVEIKISDPKVRIDEDYFRCAKLTCSADAYKCHVSSEAIADDRRNMNTVAECQDKDGKVLDSTHFTEPNPFPNDEPPYSRVADVNRDGEIKIVDSNGQKSFESSKSINLTKEEQEKIRLEQERIQKEIDENMRKLNEQLHKQQQEMQEHFAHIFGPNFPFGNNNPFNSYGQNPSPPPFSNNFPFGNGFPFGNSFGFGANWPFNNFNSFGSIGFYPYYPPVTNPYNRYPFNSYIPQLPNREDDDDDRYPHHTETFIPEFSTNSKPIQPFYPPTPQTNDEVETNTEHDDENDIFEGTTQRGQPNKIINYYDKYRYAHDNAY